MSITIIKDKSGRPIKKDGLTKYRVRVNYTVALPDGNSDYRRIERYAYGKIQAQDVEAQLTKDAAELSCLPGDIPAAFSDLVESYLASAASGKTLRQSTIDKKKQVLSHHILPFFGTYRLNQITPQVVYRWIDYINAKVLDDTGKSLSVKMRRNIFADLKAVFTFAIKRGWLDTSPLQHIDNFKDSEAVPTAHQDQHYYTSAQFDVFLDGLRKVRPGGILLRYLTLFIILFYTGARKGEANALRWEDYDQAAGTLYIRRSVNMKSKGGYTISIPKNASSFRKVKICRQIRTTLADQLAYQQQDPAWSSSWYICGGPDPIPDTSIEKANTDAASAAGLPHIRIHDFRHSHASLLINRGVLPKAIAKRLGHSTVTEVLNRYGHLYPEQDDHIIAILDNL